VPSAPTITNSTYIPVGYWNEQQPPESYNVTIIWTPPTANGGSPITAYNMYVNGSPSPIVISAQSTSHLITPSFLANTTNSITMKAQNVAGLSIFSNTFTFSL
jgi:hypothetical protein